jgi:hypothetical protein
MRPCKTYIARVVLLAVATVVCGVAQADVVSLTPAVIGQFHTTPIQTTITAPSSWLLIDYNAPAQAYDQFAMEFSLAGLPENAFVTSAIFSWYVDYSDRVFEDPLQLRAYVGDGVLSAGDINAFPSVQAAANLLAMPSVSFGRTGVNVASILNNYLAGGADFMGFYVTRPSLEPTVFQIFTDNMFPGIGPKLEVTYSVVPEAGAFSLAAGALAAGGLLVWSRKRKVVASSDSLSS